MTPVDHIEPPTATQASRPEGGELSPGTRLGRYEVAQKIARGGMAELYLARQCGIAGYEKVVALKRVRPHLADDPTFVEMFLAEARLAACLDHSNIAHVLELGSEGGEHFLALEYIHGRSVAQIVAANQRAALPLDVALTIVSETANALHYAHERNDRHGVPLGLVHRDVSPSNVMVSFDGDVKLVDFGIAKATASDQHTQSTMLKGKVRYMSPEQVQGLPLDRRSDVFALGVVCYELTTGKRCFSAPGEYALLNRVADAQYAPPSAAVADYPEELEAIVARALAVSPDDRYSSARELQRALTDFAEQAGVRISRLGLVDYLEGLYGSVPYPTVDERLTTRATPAAAATVVDVPPPRRRAGSLGALVLGIGGGAALLWLGAGAIDDRPVLDREAVAPSEVDAPEPAAGVPEPAPVPEPAAPEPVVPPKADQPDEGAAAPVAVVEPEPTPPKPEQPAAESPARRGKANKRKSRPKSRPKPAPAEPTAPPAEPKVYLPPSRQPR